MGNRITDEAASANLAWQGIEQTSLAQSAYFDPFHNSDAQGRPVVEGNEVEVVEVDED